MASRLNPSASALALAALLSGLMFGNASGQALRDPTRPPGSAESGPGEADSGLQSIVRRQGEKPRALINGELVSLGGKVGGVDGTQRLVAINEDSVVLLDASGHRETLQLTPGVNKTPVNSKPSASRKP